jgi:ATP-dependent Clp protease ATP-binding subunit ClpC
MLELAMQAATDMSCRLVGTEHLLLGLVEEGESAAARVLASGGLTPEAIRQEIKLLLGVPMPFSEENVRLIANSRWRIRL